MTTHKRQTEIFDPAHYSEKRVLVVGAGNIGSHTALALARMGIAHFALCDFDTVEMHNLASQSYTIADIGKSKIEVLRDSMLAVNETAHIALYNESIQKAWQKIQADGTIDIIVIAVDSLATRREIATLVKYAECTIIDGRMGGGQIEIHVCNASDYDSIIPTEADTDSCAARYISYTSLIIAGMITNTVKRILKGESVYASMLLHTDTFEILKT